MSIIDEINALVTADDLTIITGYPETNIQLPYVVHRPLIIDSVELAINGQAIDWDYQTTLYACGASVEASFNLALRLINALQGAWVGGTTLSTSMGYSGAMVEGHYESQVTVQLNQGGVLT